MFIYILRSIHFTNWRQGRYQLNFFTPMLYQIFALIPLPIILKTKTIDADTTCFYIAPYFAFISYSKNLQTFSFKFFNKIIMTCNVLHNVSRTMSNKKIVSLIYMIGHLIESNKPF